MNNARYVVCAVKEKFQALSTEQKAENFNEERSPLRAITTIIFDLDGTLLDSSPDIFNCVNLALREMALPEVTMEQAKKGIGPGSQVFTQTMLPRDQFYRWEELLQIYRRFYLDRCTERSTLYPGVTALLRHLRNGSLAEAPYLAVATNKPCASQEASPKKPCSWGTPITTSGPGKTPASLRAAQCMAISPGSVCRRRIRIF